LKGGGGIRKEPFSLKSLGSVKNTVGEEVCSGGRNKERAVEKKSTEEEGVLLGRDESKRGGVLGTEVRGGKTGLPGREIPIF